MADPSDRPAGTPAAPADRPRARALAESLLDIGAVALRPADPFTWTSGLVAPIYCDNRLTIAHPAVRRAIRDGFAEGLDREGLLPSTIAGTATAGIPHAAWLAEAVERPMAYVRDEAKGHGTGAKIEGRVQPGDDVVLVEDLISTGGSALDAVDALRAAGAQVRAVLAIFSYRLAAAERAFEEADVRRHVLTDLRVLVDVAHSQDRLSDAERETLQAWRADPAGWSAEHGGAHPDA
ncbi:MAG: orotate phosphoribosyltransferase [Salinibacter sp.]